MAATATFDWNAERIAELKRLWADGRSALQIADALGDGVSRSAVCGKIHRLGLSGRASPKPKTARAKPQHDHDRRLTRRFRQKAQKVETGSDFDTDGITDIVEDTDIPLDQRRTILTIESDQCRWPCGEPASPEFFFCGAPCIGEHSYCAHHYRRSIYHRATLQISDVVRARRAVQGRKNLQHARAFGGR